MNIWQRLIQPLHQIKKERLEFLMLGRIQNEVSAFERELRHLHNGNMATIQLIREEISDRKRPL